VNNDIPVLRLFPDETTEFKVSPNHYLVMGDNTMNSSDSRTWGDFPHQRDRKITFRLLAIYRAIRLGKSITESGAPCLVTQQVSWWAKVMSAPQRRYNFKNFPEHKSLTEWCHRRYEDSEERNQFFRRAKLA
jgi:hypothetical protein